MQEHQLLPHPTPPAVGAFPALAVFARAPVPGKSKTRLIPALGREGAAQLHSAFVSDTLHKVAKLKGDRVRYLFIAGGAVPPSLLPRHFGCVKQRGRGLGERLANAFELLLRQHPRAIVIGTDSPAISSSIFHLALEELRTVDAVLGPCPDGGYYLIGLRRTAPGLFRHVRLGSEFAFRDTLDRLVAHGFSCAILEPFPDIDRPQDLRKLRRELLKNPSARRLMPATWQFFSQGPAGMLPSPKQLRSEVRPQARRFTRGRRGVRQSRTLAIQPPPTTSSPS